jgi:UDP-N-acetylglucosamine--N-acetylmuramyl-(pentapeptide) pyrophosphoryl-undecaprenol N-acetylglucosamine transferase
MGIKILGFCKADNSVIVARSGLATITELSALQKPSILIPMPGTHQEANANICRDQGAAVVLKQANLNNELHLEVHYLLVSDEKKKALAEAMAHINQSGAVTKIADLAFSLVK